MNREEYTNSSKCSLNCWIRWMHHCYKLCTRSEYRNASHGCFRADAISAENL